MANIQNFEVNGVSYAYDTESRSPLAKKNVKKALDGELVYKIDEAVTETKEVPVISGTEVTKEEKTFKINSHASPTEVL